MFFEVETSFITTLNYTISPKICKGKPEFETKKRFFAKNVGLSRGNVRFGGPESLLRSQDGIEHRAYLAGIRVNFQSDSKLFYGFVPAALHVQEHTEIAVQN